MNYIVTNMLPIGAATLAGLGIGLLYLPLRGARPTAGLAATALVAEAWLACILAGALILAPEQAAGPWTMALTSAVVIWIGFVLPTLLVTQVGERLPARATVANCAHWLLVMLAQAAILQGVGLVHPA